MTRSSSPSPHRKHTLSCRYFTRIAMICFLVSLLVVLFFVLDLSAGDTRGHIMNFLKTMFDITSCRTPRKDNNYVIMTLLLQHRLHFTCIFNYVLFTSNLGTKDLRTWTRPLSYISRCWRRIFYDISPAYRSRGNHLWSHSERHRRRVNGCSIPSQGKRGIRTRQ